MATLPLKSALRQRPIHPDLPTIKVPPSTLQPSQHHPVSGEPFTAEDLQHHLLRELLDKYSGNTQAAVKVRDDAVREVRRRLEENESKRAEVEREIREKEGMREIERKVYQKQGKIKGGGE